MKRLLFFVAVLGLAGCAGARPELGLGGGYSYQRISPDTYKIDVMESRFATTGEAENLFREASEKVIESNHCSGYKIASYSTYLENAVYGAAIPKIEGKIICLR